MVAMRFKLGLSLASLRTAATFEPDEIPQKIPSSLARRRAMANASSLVVVTTPVSWESSSTLGTNPSPIPSIRCEPHFRRESSGHSAGSNREQLDRRIPLPEVSTDTGQRSSGTLSGNVRIDLFVQLLP